jgi:protein-tyrosine phosphatase
MLEPVAGYVDLHSHVLPGLDDGARDLAESMAMLGLLQKVGFEEVNATPHQKVGSWVPSAEAIATGHARVVDGLRQAGTPLVVETAAENMWDSLFFERCRDLSWPRYHGARAFLFEIPPDATPVQLEETLFQIRLKGVLPVLAHPERYASLCQDAARLERLAKQVALMVDLGALGGMHGFFESRRARKLCEQGLAVACASDAHGPEDVTSAAQGIAWIRKRLGEAAVTRLLADNPRRLLAGELPEA